MVAGLERNGFYTVAWMSIWIGHLTLYSFPGLFAFVSFAAIPGFNSVYVLWQQYGSFISGILLVLTVTGFFITAYVKFLDEGTFTKDIIL